MKAISKTNMKIIALLMLIVTAFGCSKDDSPKLNASLNSIMPLTGIKGTIVTINGSDFGSNISDVKVFFNETEAIVQSVNNTQIITKVPPRAYTGIIKINIRGVELLGQEFTYLISETNVATLAGSTSGFADGQGSAAQFGTTAGMAVDNDGNIFVADFSNNRIRKVTPEGEVTTFAGSGVQGLEDGPAAQAQFYGPIDVDIDSQGNLFVADVGNHRIRKITPDGQVSSFAGSTSGYEDGIGATAKFKSPEGLCIDKDDNIYVSGRNFKIRKITPDAEVSTLAGSDSGHADGLGSEAQFGILRGIDVDENGFVYVTESFFNMIRKISPYGDVTTIAGSTNAQTGYVDGSGETALFNQPYDVAVDNQGNVYVTDRINYVIRKISASGIVSTFAGSNVSGYEDGSAEISKFNKSWGLAFNPVTNTLYVADTNNHRIRMILQE